jgi:hypothetical protein
LDTVDGVSSHKHVRVSEAGLVPEIKLKNIEETIVIWLELPTMQGIQPTI